MRILQAKVAIRFFRASFLKKYDVVNFYSYNRPALFFGCYRKIIPGILRHKELGVLIWTGGDALTLHKNKNNLRRLREKKNLKHIAISNFISDDLKRLGIPHRCLPIVPFDNNQFLPTPMGPKIYIYSAHKNPNFYGANIIEKLKVIFPDIVFATCYAQPPHCVPRNRMHEVYNNCFLGIRLTPHDGLSNTVIELGLMGRKCVWNGNTPNAIPWKSIDDVVKIIEKERKLIGTVNMKVADAVSKYMDVGDEWLDTDFYEL